MMTIYSGQCHCAKVMFEATLNLADPYQCNCSLCKRRNAVMHRVLTSHFHITHGESELMQYQFGSKVAEHYFCKHCGIFVYSRPFTSETEFAINLHNFDIDYSTLPIRLLDGQSI